MLQQIDLSRADLNLLVLFEAVLEEGHVGRAAARLNLSPSAVSHGLSRLRRLLNDPLFLKTPRGVVPTARGAELAEPVRAILAQTRDLLSASEPFDPSRSRRRFSLGAPDGVSAVILAALLKDLRREAPGVDIGIRQLLPVPEETSLARAWMPTLGDLETRALDIAIIPTGDVPARFTCRPLFKEDFVIVVRSGHPLAGRPTMADYLRVEHVVVSMSGDPNGFVDELLARDGLSRRIALTLPNFMFAMAVVADSDFACALPRRFADMFASRFGVVAVQPPFAMPSFQMFAVALESAMADPAVSWLMGLLTAQGRRG